MAHNRSMLIKRASFDEALVHTYGEVRDEFQQGLPEEMPEDLQEALGETLGDPVSHSEEAAQSQELASDRIELTQQQLSRGAAVLVLAGFGIFIVGYLMATYQPERSQELIPQELYGSFFGEHMQTEVPSPTSHEYGRFASYKEADKLRKELEAHAQAVTVIPHTSYSASGTRYEWFSVCDDQRQKYNDTSSIKED